jgi:hypothetical protein
LKTTPVKQKKIESVAMEATEVGKHVIYDDFLAQNGSDPVVVVIPL